MGAGFFSFKQFTVYHDKCAMKVGTDGVLLGAWTETNNAKNILDIGTGSGLIALMLAQRSNAALTAIDIDADAVLQAREKAANSPFKNQIRVIKADIVTFSSECKQTFDVIVSNPPFFKNSLEAPNAQRTLARHATADLHIEILKSAQKLLTPTGRLCLILPTDDGLNLTVTAMDYGLCCSKQTLVISRTGATPKRILLEFRKTPTETTHNELIIETNNRHEYSSEFTALLKEYYLYL
jgi:tRNA1Val (adenine37-N6)-methyltransferase